MKKLFYIFVFAGFSLCAGRVQSVSAQTISDLYTRTSEPETFFSGAATSGYTTLNSYAGPVEVIVSGTWVNASEDFDAAYVFRVSGQEVISVHGYSMTLNLNGCAWWQECGGRHFCNWIEFIEGRGLTGGICNTEPSAPFVPPYNNGHEYKFVINVGSTPVTPTFGVGDGGSHDNSGGLHFTIYQLAPGGPTSARASSWGQLKTIYH